jgi:hypothetical protein
MLISYIGLVKRYKIVTVVILYYFCFHQYLEQHVQTYHRRRS